MINLNPTLDVSLEDEAQAITQQAVHLAMCEYAKALNKYEGADKISAPVSKIGVILYLAYREELREYCHLLTSVKDNPVLFLDYATLSSFISFTESLEIYKSNRPTQTFEYKIIKVTIPFVFLDKDRADEEYTMLGTYVSELEEYEHLSEKDVELLKKYAVLLADMDTDDVHSFCASLPEIKALRKANIVRPKVASHEDIFEPSPKDDAEKLAKAKEYFVSTVLSDPLLNPSEEY